MKNKTGVLSGLLRWWCPVTTEVQHWGLGECWELATSFWSCLPKWETEPTMTYSLPFSTIFPAPRTTLTQIRSLKLYTHETICLRNILRIAICGICGYVRDVYLLCAQTNETLKILFNAPFCGETSFFLGWKPIIKVIFNCLQWNRYRFKHNQHLELLWFKITLTNIF